jgi:hypothetical protein
MARGVHTARPIRSICGIITSVDYSPATLIRVPRRGKTPGHARFEDNSPGTRLKPALA